MFEEYVQVPTPDGIPMETFIARPDGDGPFPGVLMYMPRPGLIEELLDLARRFADNGYCCVVPNLYYRLGRKLVFHPDPIDPYEREINTLVSNAIKIPGRVIGDTAAVLEYIEKDPKISDGPMGTIGYCMGGRYSPFTAGIYPEKFKATVSLFGTAMLSDQYDDALPNVVDKIQGEIYFGIAENDKGTPPELVVELTAILEAKCPAKWEVEVHKGAEHGYAFAGRKVYSEQANEASWDYILPMFERQLKNK